MACDSNRDLVHMCKLAMCMACLFVVIEAPVQGIEVGKKWGKIYLIMHSAY